PARLLRPAARGSLTRLPRKEHADARSLWGSIDGNGPAVKVHKSLHHAEPQPHPPGHVLVLPARVPRHGLRPPGKERLEQLRQILFRDPRAAVPDLDLHPAPHPPPPPPHPPPPPPPPHPAAPPLPPPAPPPGRLP